MLANHRRRRGQALTEFALVMPILLLLMMGIFDMGRAFLSYAMASDSLRIALRNAEVFGFADGTTIRYTDCAGMRAAIKKTFFVGTPDISIVYQHTRSGAPDTVCTDSMASIPAADVDNGDLLVITVRNNVKLITPLVSQILPNLTFEFKGERTIVRDIALTTRASGDVDYDGLLDNWETEMFCPTLTTIDESDPAQVAARTACLKAHVGTDDPDGDGCNNGCEETNNTCPVNPPPAACFTSPINMLGTDAKDTDGDGLTDGEELYKYTYSLFPYRTDPLNPDSDGDGLSDGAEVVTDHTDPLNPDTDGDTLMDGAEVHGDFGYVTNPLLADTDGDGLDDNVEINGDYGYVTDPTNPDMDGDGASDGDEELGLNDCSIQTDPLNPPTLSIISTLSVTRPSTTGTANFPVFLNYPTYSGTVNLFYATADGTATSGDDYDGVGGTLTFELDRLCSDEVDPGHRLRRHRKPSR